MTEPSLNLDRGFTVSVYFPPGSDPVWVSDFLSRVAEDAYSMPSDSLDAFVVGHAGDVLGIDCDDESEVEIDAAMAAGEPVELVDVYEPTAEEHQQDALAHTHDSGTDHWGGRWAWRCDGHQHCTGDISLGHLTKQAAASSYLRHVDECHGPEPTEKQLHERRACPGWEYATTEAPRKQWDDADRPPEGHGWERNVDAGRDGWDRFDYTEESYWRRRVVSAPR